MVNFSDENWKGKRIDQCFGKLNLSGLIATKHVCGGGLPYGR